MSARARTTAAAALAGLFALLVACSLPNVGLWSGKGVADTGLYGQYGDRILRGDVPYRDFYIEFPPGALPALALPDVVDGHYVAGFHAFQLLCAAACIVLLAWTLSGAGASRTRLFGAVVLAGLAPAALGAITLNAFDFWPAALTVAAVALVVNRHERAGLAFLGLATAAKVFPAALLPLLLAHVWRRAAAASEPGGGRRAAARALGAYVVAGAVVTLPFLAVAPGGLGFSLRTQLERGLQVESLAASLIVTLHHLGATTVEVVVGRPYSLDLAGGLPDAIAALTTVASVAAVLAALLAWWRGDPTLERLLLAVATTVTGLVAFGRVLSPQYLVWLIPLVAMTAPRKAGAAWALLALSLGLTQVWFPSRFFEVVELQGAGWVVLARNLVLTGAYVALLVPLVRGAGGARAAFRLPGRQGPSRAATTA
jgi:hypothetical protein